MIGIPDYIKNNQQLLNFSDTIINYPIPEDTELIDVEKMVTLTSNGNHCDFIVGLLYESNLTMTEIESYYADVEFPPVRSEKQGWEDWYSTGLHPSIQPIIEFDLEFHQLGKIRYKITVEDAGYPPGLDFRCR